METIGKKGQTVNVLVSASLKDDILSGMFMDITDRKKAEEELLTKEKEITSIYNNISDVLYLLSVEGVNNYRFISVNQAFLNITEIKGKSGFRSICS